MRENLGSEAGNWEGGTMRGDFRKVTKRQAAEAVGVCVDVLSL